MSSSLQPENCHIALLSGGTSSEREISIASGEGARQALEEAGFIVTMLDPSKKEDLKALIDNSFDVAFICMHGKYGEDGTLQGFLETIRLPYTGSGVWSSALAMNKHKSKMFYHTQEIPTPPAVSITQDDSYNIDDIEKYLGTNCVVKPSSDGSAIGVYVSHNKDELQKILQEALSQNEEVLVERYVQGREFTVAVVGNKELTALPVIEIIPQNSFYDYESKYAPGGSQHICPASLPDKITKEMQSLALQAHRALECSGVSRSDFILDANDELWILETNTIPGMTATSLLPDAARAAGWSFPELCTKLVELALE